MSSANKNAKAKSIALQAAAARPSPAPDAYDINLRGKCLVIGGGKASELVKNLTVPMVYLNNSSKIDGQLFGQIGSVTGSLGRFKVSISNPDNQLQNNTIIPCDTIFDMSGEAEIFSSSQNRAGYFRANPHDKKAISREIEKINNLGALARQIFHITFEQNTCVHARAGQTGCNRCLDVCPTGAISSDGNTVKIDAGICNGCGACSAICPTGAVSYNNPPVNFVFEQINVLARNFLTEGGAAPRLLVYDTQLGADLATMAQKLPDNTLTLQVTALASFGHAEMLVALAAGFCAVDMLVFNPQDSAVLQTQIDLALALTIDRGSNHIRIIRQENVDQLFDFSNGNNILAVPVSSELMRSKAARLAVGNMLPASTEPISLPKGAPYGAVRINTDSCTFCLACTNLCPTGALLENTLKPEIGFRENICIQCGICENGCPENAIKLVPRLNLHADAAVHKPLHREIPYQCIECGKPYGVKSTIERIIVMLESSAAKFDHSANIRLICSCDDCKLIAQNR